MRFGAGGQCNCRWSECGGRGEGNAGAWGLIRLRTPHASIRKWTRGTDGDGSVTAYLRSGKVIRLVTWVGLSNKDVSDDYRYGPRGLRRVRETERYFKYDTKTGVMDSGRYGRTTIRVYEFRDGRLVGWHGAHSKGMRRGAASWRLSKARELTEKADGFRTAALSKEARPSVAR